MPCTLAGGMHKLQAVNFSLDLHRRYTFWSGMLGGYFPDARRISAPTSPRCSVTSPARRCAKAGWA